MLILKRSELERVLDVNTVNRVVEEGFRRYYNGEISSPLRMHVDVEAAGGIYLLMPSFDNGGSAFGSKMLSLYRDNPERGKPAISSMYLLCNGEDGAFLAMMEGGFITAIRTAAASAVATKYLAAEDAEVHGVIGTGLQAMFQAEAIAAVRPCRRLIVYNRTRSRAERFAAEAAARLGVEVVVAASVAEVGAEADIITTVTTSHTPVIHLQDVRPGCHLNAVGAFKPVMQEIGADLVVGARLVVDSLEACLAETGDLLLPMQQGLLKKEQIHGELGAVVCGELEGRTSPEQITLFESVGVSFEDLVTAELAYHRAVKAESGTEVNLRA